MEEHNGFLNFTAQIGTEVFKVETNQKGELEYIE